MTGQGVDRDRNVPAKLGRRKFLTGSAAAVAVLSGTFVFKPHKGTVIRPDAGQTVVNPVQESSGKTGEGINISQDNVTIVNPDIKGFHWGIRIQRKADGSVPKNVKILFDPTKPGASTARGITDCYMAVFVERGSDVEVGGVGGAKLNLQSKRAVEIRGVAPSGNGDPAIHVHHCNISAEVAGLKFLYDASLGYPRESTDVLFEDNVVSGASEEHISCDIYGNDANRCATREIDSISAVDLNQKTVQLGSIRKWGASKVNLNDYWMVFNGGGAASGQRVKILSHSGATFTVSDPNGVLSSTLVGADAIIGAPFTRVQMRRNVIHAERGLSGFDLYGFSFDSVIEDNIIYPPTQGGIAYPESGLRADPNNPGVSFPQAIHVASIVGLVPSLVMGRNLRATCEGNMIRNNTVKSTPGDISFSLFNYGSRHGSRPPSFTPVKNSASGNVFEAGGQVWADAFSPTLRRMG